MTAKPPTSPEVSTTLDQSRGEPVAGILFVLRISEGPDVGTTRVLDGIKEGRVLIGKSAVCTLRLSDPTVSRRHAALRREAHAWRLEDLESSNGTRVNGVRIREAFLTGGEIVTLGATSLRLTRAGAAPLEAPSDANHFGRFFGESAVVRQQFSYWSSLATSALGLLIEGETGTGKELLAEALHDFSPRAGRPYVALDCSAREAEIDPALLEQASGGTLVIDEPAELGALAQGQLVALLDRAAEADARIITTSRRDLDLEVQEGRFREDLLYRLAGATIELPPLRRRQGDVALLARHFWKQLGGAGDLSADELSLLEGKTWPGNARELLNAIAERLAVGPAAPRLDSVLPGAPSRPPTERSPQPDTVARILAMDLPYVRARQEVLRDFEARYVQNVLDRNGGNVSRAAAVSGLARRYFQILKSRTR